MAIVKDCSPRSRCHRSSMRPRFCSPAASTARCLLAEEAARGDVQPIYVSVGPRLGGGRTRGGRRASSPTRRSRPRAAARRRCSVDMRDVYAADSLGRQRPAARVSHAGRRRLSAGPQHRAARKGRRVLRGAPSIDRLVTRHARTQSVSRRDAGVLAAPWRARCRSASLTDSRSTRPTRDSSKAEVIARGDRARRAVRADAVVHEPALARRPLPRHCGVCSKCRERHDAFVEAGVAGSDDVSDRDFDRLKARVLATRGAGAGRPRMRLSRRDADAAIVAPPNPQAYVRRPCAASAACRVVRRRLERRASRPSAALIVPSRRVELGRLRIRRGTVRATT